MSYRRFRWPKAAPKKPPPEHGIKVKGTSHTWWGERWISALEEVLQGDSARLARGRTYARTGRAHDLTVTSSGVKAKVTGSRARPYTVTIQLTKLTHAVWQRAIRLMAEQAAFSAELLAEQMPRAINEIFQEAGASLFPEHQGDLTTSCSCPDWGDPCKHVAATHYVLGAALDSDPFLLFELRGRGRREVLEALRAARGAEPLAPPRATKAATAEQLTTKAAKRGGKRAAKPRSERTAPGERAAAKGEESDRAPRAPAFAAPSEPAPTVMLSNVTLADYDRLRAPLPPMHFSFAPPRAPGTTLDQLGPLTNWTAKGSPASLLSPLCQLASELAEQLATAEDEPEETPEPHGAARRPSVAPRRHSA
ncbi:MAG: SWIM zinc finger family protein [Polyangiaceae bacterium]|nr:SWIM zinc finger family protein [Polyangiaceae bacterium]MCW5791954.1 SWIM zinc finger family protein [Polyangiaceae bacterium]